MKWRAIYRFCEERTGKQFMIRYDDELDARTRRELRFLCPGEFTLLQNATWRGIGLVECLSLAKSHIRHTIAK